MAHNYPLSLSPPLSIVADDAKKSGPMLKVFKLCNNWSALLPQNTARPDSLLMRERWAALSNHHDYWQRSHDRGCESQNKIIKVSSSTMIHDMCSLQQWMIGVVHKLYLFPSFLMTPSIMYANTFVRVSFIDIPFTNVYSIFVSFSSLLGNKEVRGRQLCFSELISVSNRQEAFYCRQLSQVLRRNDKLLIVALYT